MRGTLNEELAKYEFALPIMSRLSAHLKPAGLLKGAKIGWHCHLTEITAAAADVLLECGAKLYLSECNSDTTNTPAVEYMRNQGAKVFLGPNSSTEVLKLRPEVISDTGGVLIKKYELSRGAEKYVHGASEITTSGITALGNLPEISVPIIDINSGHLKTYIENFHGVGDGVVDLLAQLTGRVWAGRRAAVVGYGSVGAGIADYLRRLHAEVVVVEQDQVKKLIAHYNGYTLSSLADALKTCELIVTATGRLGLISSEHWQLAAHGTLFVNVGHWATELDISALKDLSSGSRETMPYVKEFALPNGQGGTKHIYVVADGNPANVVVLAGSPEPTLIHLTTELLCMNYLLEAHKSGRVLDLGPQKLPPQVERQAAELALQALNLSNLVNT